MRATERATIIGILALTALLGPALAWHGPGHVKATRLATAALPAELPDFFTAGVETIAHCSVDPDLFRLRAHPELRDAEVPEHFIDLDLLGGEPLPPNRSTFVALCARKGLKCEKVGFLPYAVVEWTQRLTIAFAEHRKWAANPHIRAKCLVYAGILSHYAQDACQPLHTTIHYDGRARADGTSPRSGVHTRVDALLQKLTVGSPKAFAAAVKPRVYRQLFRAVAGEIRRTHALVDKVYEIADSVPPLEKPLPPGSPATRFAAERLSACANFTASLFLTAWSNSARVELPDWHRRGK